MASSLILMASGDTLRCRAADRRLERATGQAHADAASGPRAAPFTSFAAQLKSLGRLVGLVIAHLKVFGRC